MNIEHLLNQTCTITRRVVGEEKTAYGRKKREETPSDHPCTLQQAERDEEAVGEMSDTRWTLWLLPGTEIGSADTVEVDGQVYEVEGEPETLRNARTAEAKHVEATLRKTAGPS